MGSKRSFLQIRDGKMDSGCGCWAHVERGSRSSVVGRTTGPPILLPSWAGQVAGSPYPSPQAWDWIEFPNVSVPGTRAWHLGGGIRPGGCRGALEWGQQLHRCLSALQVDRVSYLLQEIYGIENKNNQETKVCAGGEHALGLQAAGLTPQLPCHLNGSRLMGVACLGPPAMARAPQVVWSISHFPSTLSPEGPAPQTASFFNGINRVYRIFCSFSSKFTDLLPSLGCWLSGQPGQSGPVGSPLA